MQIHPSTIAMALLTCVPFGLAIRDTVNGKGRAPDADELDEYAGEYDEDALEKYAAEQAELARLEEEREAREKATRAEMRKDLFSDVPAAFAGRLSSLRLGTPLTAIDESTHTRLARLGDDTGTSISLDGEVTLDFIRIADAYVDDDLCGWMNRELRARWGAPVDGVWLNEANRVRARLEDESGCTLTVERAVRPADWYGQTPTAIIPTWAIGKTPARLLETMPDAPPDIADDLEDFRWSAAGVGRGEGTTSITATVEKGKIVTLHASVQLRTEDTDELTAHLTKLHGAPTTDDSGLVWKKAKPAVKLELDSGYAYLTVGKLSD